MYILSLHSPVGSEVLRCPCCPSAAVVVLQEDQEEYAESGEKQVVPRSKRPVTKHWNWVGLAICMYYVAAALYYFIIRGRDTLNMGYLG